MKKILALTAATLAAVTLTPAQASPISSTTVLDTVYTGAIPDGTAPWLQAEFTGNTGSNTGTLTLTSLLTEGDFVQGGTNANATVGWAFYVSPVTYQSLQRARVPARTVLTTSTWRRRWYNTGPVPGIFNLSFSWDNVRPLDEPAIPPLSPSIRRPPGCLALRRRMAQAGLPLPTCRASPALAKAAVAGSFPVTVRVPTAATTAHPAITTKCRNPAHWP